MGDKNHVSVQVQVGTPTNHILC